MQQSYLSGQTVETIYFGGGTPSLMPGVFLQEILDTIRNVFSVSPDAEVTLEANPDDFSPEKVGQWKSSGINRLSIGIQSFFEADLVWMNRAHNATMAHDAISMAQQAGITNISVDLIYGGPTLSDEHWKQNLEQVFASGVPHLSSYALTVEPSTALDVMITKGRKEPVDPDKQARHFEMLMEAAAEAGFEQYEISNLAKPGWRSRHNSSYWQGIPYLGIGPSAHSFDGKKRRWNISNNALYLSSIEGNLIPFEEEELTTENRINEYLMTSLRTIEGISLTAYALLAGPEATTELLKRAERFISHDQLELADTHIRLTKTGKFLADGIASDLFL